MTRNEGASAHYLRDPKTIGPRPLDMDEVGRGAQEFLLREAGADSLDDLRRRLSDDADAARAIIEAALSPPARTAGSDGPA